MKVNYPAFVDLLSQHPDQFTPLRLRELNIRNILFYQAELLYLKRQLDDIEEDDAREHPKLEEHVTRSWYPAMARSSQAKHIQLAPSANLGTVNQAVPINQQSATSPHSAPQMATVREKYCDKVLEIRETLAKYNQAVSHWIQQEKLDSPPERTVRKQHEWLKRPGFGNSFLSGTTADAWKPAAGDQFDSGKFMTVTPADNLSFQVARMFMAIRTHMPWGQTEDQVFSIDEGDVAKGLSVVLACVVPVVPIIILYFIGSLLVRIGLILVFTAVSATVLVFGLRLDAEKVLTVTLS